MNIQITKTGYFKKFLRDEFSVRNHDTQVGFQIFKKCPERFVFQRHGRVNGQTEFRCGYLNGAGRQGHLSADRFVRRGHYRLNGPAVGMETTECRHCE